MTSERRAVVAGQAGSLSRAAWLFVALGLLLAPVFAHGCHGDDVDHEPLLIPLKKLENRE